MTDAEGEPPGQRARRWPSPWLLGGVAVVFVWVLVIGVLLFGAKADAESGRDRLEALRDADEPAAALLHGGAGELRLAAADFRSARRVVRSPIVSPLRALPVVGRQLRAFDALAATATEVAEAGGEALDRIDDRLASGSTAGGERVELLAEIASATAELEGVLAGVDLGPSEALVGPLASARADIEDELVEMRTIVADARAVADGLLPMFRGPSRYLVLGANNAEMQVTSGMPLSIGVLEVDDGQLTLPDMQPAGDLLLPEDAVPLDRDIQALWGPLDPEQDFRFLGMTTRFTATAAQAARMWEAVGGGAVDGVILVDPVVLQALLASTGPIELDGERFDADNVVEELLKQQYLDFADDNEARRDRLGEIAKAAVEGLDGGGWDVAQLSTDLSAAAGARHVLAWSPHADQQRAWAAAGVAGAMEEDALFVGLLNRSAAKLDPFIEVEATLETDGPTATVTVTVSNSAPLDLPKYVIGSNTGDLVDGEYDAYLSFTVPGVASDVTVEDPYALGNGTDGPYRVVTTRVRVLSGETAVRTLRFALPDDARHLTLQPSARVPEIAWSVDGEEIEVGTGRRAAW
jgi:hypothetical protein